MLLAMSELHSVSISEIVAYMFALLKLFHETISGVDTSVKNVAHDIAHKVAVCQGLSLRFLYHSGRILYPVNIPSTANTCILSFYF